MQDVRDRSLNMLLLKKHFYSLLDFSPKPQQTKMRGSGELSLLGPSNKEHCFFCSDTEILTRICFCQYFVL